MKLKFYHVFSRLDLESLFLVSICFKGELMVEEIKKMLDVLFLM